MVKFIDTYVHIFIENFQQVCTRGQNILLVPTNAKSYAKTQLWRKGFLFLVSIVTHSISPNPLSWYLVIHKFGLELENEKIFMRRGKL